uniref:Uncharacterized protein n=1 Tax=Sphaerodactylus townsendi TaxID=933632 RepID=A0ACB8G2C7_9SAUR
MQKRRRRKVCPLFSPPESKESAAAAASAGAQGLPRLRPAEGKGSQRGRAKACPSLPLPGRSRRRKAAVARERGAQGSAPPPPTPQKPQRTGRRGGTQAWALTPHHWPEPQRIAAAVAAAQGLPSIASPPPEAGKKGAREGYGAKACPRLHPLAEAGEQLPRRVAASLKACPAASLPCPAEAGEERRVAERLASSSQKPEERPQSGREWRAFASAPAASLAEPKLEERSQQRSGCQRLPSLLSPQKPEERAARRVAGARCLPRRLRPAEAGEERSQQREWRALWLFSLALTPRVSQKLVKKKGRSSVRPATLLPPPEPKKKGSASAAFRPAPASEAGNAGSA